LDTTTLTWGLRDRWSSSGMWVLRQRMVAQRLAIAGDRPWSATVDRGHSAPVATPVQNSRVLHT
jgi:hypothetical protein